MAGNSSLTADHSKHFTTTGGAGNHDTLTLASAVSSVWVTNNDASVKLYVRLDGTAPVAGADETLVVPPNSTRKLGHYQPFTVVKVISASAIVIDVEAAT